MSTMEFETFREIGKYQIGTIKQDEPSCFNGMVRVKRYRVTVEEIKEPDEVIVARLQKMWDNCTNHHNRDPLVTAASSYGVEL